MLRAPRGRAATALAGLATLALLPGIAAAQSLGPSTLIDVPAPVRAVVVFLLALLSGGVVLARRADLVDRSVDGLDDGLLLSTVYGVLAHLLLVFVAGFLLTQLARIGVRGPVVTGLGVAALALTLLALGGLGLVVVGTWLTDLRGERRPWNGLLVGAALGALGWLFLPIVGGVAAWVLVVSIGIGGPARNWVHAERTVEEEPTG